MIQPSAYILKIVTELLLVSMTSAVFFARMVPALKVFLLYGKTQLDNDEKSFNLPILKWISELYVPKKYFLHFYIISFALSSLLLLYRKLFCETGEYSPDGLVFTTLLAIQGFRRCLECLLLEKSHPKAVIHFSHYIVGVLFYVLANNVAFLALFTTSTTSSNHVLVSTVIIFILGSILQSSSHYHLSTLVKYSLPTFSLFQITACPHYFAEIIIYSSLLLITPTDLRPTVILLVLWIVVNLTVSAEQTLQFYRKKFKNAPSYAIIPYLY